MTLNPTFTLESQARLAALDFATLQAAIRSQAKARGLTVLEDSATRILVELREVGSYEARPLDSPVKGGSEIRVRAALPDRLQLLQGGFAEHLADIDAQTATALRWSGGAAAGSLPPNVHLTRLRSVTPLGRSFLRIAIQAQDLSSFREDAIHFRLLLPPAGCTSPQWPQLAENGATLWPKGDKALHRPVYTTRSICHDSNTMEFDLFVHDGGRATNWARSARAGDQLAIIGPGGGGIPDTRRILIYADETALPAAARILETLPRDSTGTALLLADGGADCGYPVSAPPGISLRWINRATTPDNSPLATAALADLPDHCDHFLWFASEKSETKQVRETLRPAGADPKVDAATSYIAAYWSKS